MDAHFVHELMQQLDSLKTDLKELRAISKENRFDFGDDDLWGVGYASGSEGAYDECITRLERALAEATLVSEAAKSQTLSK